MSAPFHHQLSAHSDTLTQQSPHKHPTQHRNISSSNPSTHNNHHLEIDYMRLKQQTRRQLESCYEQINLLKQELYRKNQEIQNLEDNIILKLRQELNLARKDSIKYCQSEEKVKKQLEKMRQDNQSLVVQIDRIKKERKIYYEKLDRISHMHEEMKRELESKEKSYKKYFDKAMVYEKDVDSLKYELDDLRAELREKQKNLYEHETSYKELLQKNFLLENELRTFQIKNKDQELVIANFHQRMNQCEKYREDLQDRIEELERDNEMVRSRMDERQGQKAMEMGEKNSLIEIQSLITQVNQVLDRKAHEKNKTDRLGMKFKASLQCLQRTIKANK